MATDLEAKPSLAIHDTRPNKKASFFSPSFSHTLTRNTYEAPVRPPSSGTHDLLYYFFSPDVRTLIVTSLLPLTLTEARPPQICFQNGKEETISAQTILRYALFLQKNRSQDHCSLSATRHLFLSNSPIPSEKLPLF